MQQSLRRLGLRHGEHPRVVLLSAGSKARFFFEDTYLARYLGYTLVEGGTSPSATTGCTSRPWPASRRSTSSSPAAATAGSIPLSWGGGRARRAGDPARHAAGNVTIANTPGCGLIESPIFMAFLPHLCRRYLGEELLIPSIPTWWCGDPDQFRYVREHFDELVLKPAFAPSGDEEILGSSLSGEKKDELLRQIEHRPYDYIAQELVHRSAVPVFRDGRVESGHVAIRAFMVSNEDHFDLMPGGSSGIAPTTDPMQLSIVAGDGSKDLWVQADGPVQPVSLLSAEDTPVPLRRTSVPSSRAAWPTTCTGLGSRSTGPTF